MEGEDEEPEVLPEVSAVSENMTQTIDITPETKLRFDFFNATTIRQKIEIKRKARAAGYEELAREFEKLGFLPVPEEPK